MSWAGKRVFVTGHEGFIGRRLVLRLAELGAIPLHEKTDYRYSHPNLDTADFLFHLAAKTGGVGYASHNHGLQFADNVLLNTNVLAAALHKRKPCVVVSSACIYPQTRDDIIITEYASNMREPVADSYGYGMAKLVMEDHARLLRREGVRVVIARPFNTYGPGDRTGEKSHVIPSILEKLYFDDPVLKLWGPGWQRRAFTYVDDTVDALLLLGEKGESGEAYNVGATEESVTVEDLAKRLMNLSGIHKPIEWQQGPMGHKLRAPFLSKLNNLGFKPKYSLNEGLKATIDAWEAIPR